MQNGEPLLELEMALIMRPTCTGGKKKREKWQPFCLMAAKSRAGQLSNLATWLRPDLISKQAWANPIYRDRAVAQ